MEVTAMTVGYGTYTGTGNGSLYNYGYYGGGGSGVDHTAYMLFVVSNRRKSKPITKYKHATGNGIGNGVVDTHIVMYDYLLWRLLR